MKKRNDLLLIAALLLAAAALYLLTRPGQQGAWAVVIQDGVETARCPLSTDQTLTVGTETYNILQISGGEASISDANCPDRTCVRIGPVSRRGETIVCLPHRLVIRIEGGETPPFDAGTR